MWSSTDCSNHISEVPYNTAYCTIITNLNAQLKYEFIKTGDARTNICNTKSNQTFSFSSSANCFQEFSGAKQGSWEVRRSAGSQLCHPIALHHRQHEQEDCHRLQHLQRQDGVPLQLRRHIRVAWRHGGNCYCNVVDHWFQLIPLSPLIFFTCSHCVSQQVCRKLQKVENHCARGRIRELSCYLSF